MYINWGLALFSTITSLIFSEYLNFAPCSLCWYQRVFMYSLVFIIPTGLLIKDKKLFYYTSILSLMGALFAFYHNLIYYDLISEGFKICSADLSCKTKQFELFGFVGIPALSFIAFVTILSLSWREKIHEK